MNAQFEIASFSKPVYPKDRKIQSAETATVLGHILLRPESLPIAPRLAPVRMSDRVDSMNAVTGMMRDLGRPRTNMWEVASWEDVMSVEDG